MKLSSKILININKKFKEIPHPLNMQNDGKLTYAMWQYERGLDTLSFYFDKYSLYDILKNKEVLDVACGAAGKTLFYVKSGAKHVTGIDIVPYYEQEAKELQNELDIIENFTFICGNATKMDFPDNTFDTIIANDAIEHVDKPLEVINECLRVLKPNGKLYFNFPPYYHPYGAHLSDAINIPWCHIFFSEKTLIESYKHLVKSKPDGERRIDFRFSKNANGKEYISYINKMTLKRFKKIKKQINGKNVYYKEVPLKNQLKILTKVPVLREMFVKMVVCVYEKK